ncbi:MAG: signal peptidase I [Oscillospiraceae bacterium]
MNEFENKIIINSEYEDEVTENQENPQDNFNHNFNDKYEGMSNLKYEIASWLRSLVLAISLVLIFAFLGFSNVNISGMSMLPTLEDGNRVILYSLFYEPKRSDIIVFEPNNEPDALYVKRIVGLPGDIINIDFNKKFIYINNKILIDNFTEDTKKMLSDVKYPLTVPEDRYFVLGDNRDNSSDSRDSRVGFVHKDKVKGKALLRFWPLKDVRFFK